MHHTRFYLSITYTIIYSSSQRRGLNLYTIYSELCMDSNHGRTVSKDYGMASLRSRHNKRYILIY